MFMLLKCKNNIACGNFERKASEKWLRVVIYAGEDVDVQVTINLLDH